MSDIRVRGVTLSGRRAIALGVAFVALLLILGGGTLLRAEAPASQPTHSPQVGRTTMICTTSAPLSAEARVKTEVSAVAIREGTRSTWLTEHIDAGHEVSQGQAERARQGRGALPDQRIDRYRGRWSHGDSE